MRKHLLPFAVLFALSVPAATVASEKIRVENAWARESPPTVTNGAAYATLINLGDEADNLVGASGNVAESIELHTHLLEKNVVKMRPVDAIVVDPGTPTMLKPGGLHLMLIDLKEPLKEGQRFPLTLKFEKAGNIEVEFTVKGLAVSGAEGVHGGMKQ